MPAGYSRGAGSRGLAQSERAQRAGTPRLSLALSAADASIPRPCLPVKAMGALAHPDADYSARLTFTRTDGAGTFASPTSIIGRTVTHHSSGSA